MTEIAFRKYQGLGNDFILIDNRHSKEPVLSPAQAAKLCDRNFGIGGDGVSGVKSGVERTRFCLMHPTQCLHAFLSRHRAPYPIRPGLIACMAQYACTLRLIYVFLVNRLRPNGPMRRMCSVSQVIHAHALPLTGHLCPPSGGRDGPHHAHLQQVRRKGGGQEGRWRGGEGVGMREDGRGRPMRIYNK